MQRTKPQQDLPLRSNKKKFVGALPFIFAELIFAFVYYAFVVRWIPVLFSLSETAGLVEGILFHVIFFLCQVSFFRTTLTDPGMIPDGYLEEPEAEVQASSEPNESINASDSAGLIVSEAPKERAEIRTCKKCIKNKPDRAHHCSQCKRCILKMDHHCPWVNNCVGFFNYKFFVLFLTWTVVLAAFVSACLLDPCFSLSQYGNQKNGRDPVLFVVFIVGVVFGIGLALFAITHYVYISMNSTTIEVMEKKSKRGNIYNLGWRRNFTEIFGDNPLLWFIPVHTSKGDGLTFPTYEDDVFV